MGVSTIRDMALDITRTFFLSQVVQPQSHRNHTNHAIPTALPVSQHGLLTQSPPPSSMNSVLSVRIDRDTI
jgi:hypothetical protein